MSFDTVSDLSEPADLVGRTFSSSRPYDVGREKIREFADAIGDPNPVYRDPAVADLYGHPDVVAPPTFPIVIAFEPLQAMLTDLDLPLDQIMHADQKFSAHRPIMPGDRLTATLTIESVRRMAGNTIIATRTEVATVDGEPVTTAGAKIIQRSGQ